MSQSSSKCQNKLNLLLPEVEFGCVDKLGATSFPFGSSIWAKWRSIGKSCIVWYSRAWIHAKPEITSMWSPVWLICFCSKCGNDDHFFKQSQDSAEKHAYLNSKKLKTAAHLSQNSCCLERFFMGKFQITKIQPATCLAAFVSTVFLLLFAQTLHPAEISAEENCRTSAHTVYCTWSHSQLCLIWFFFCIRRKSGLQ